MKARFLYLISFLFFIIVTVNGQNRIKYIKNATINYHVERKSMEFIDTNNIIPTKYYIRVDLNSKQRSEVKNIMREDWIKLLNDIHSDWAANLILYDIYERDAFMYFSIIRSKERWRLSQKEKDIKYWSEHLK